MQDPTAPMTQGLPPIIELGGQIVLAFEIAHGPISEAQPVPLARPDGSVPNALTFVDAIGRRRSYVLEERHEAFLRKVFTGTAIQTARALPPIRPS